MKKQTDPFTDVSWDDINDWADDTIVARGRKYQQQKRVSKLAKADDGSLVAWVEGATRYVTKVDLDDEDDLHSICTCLYRFDCKHGVATLLEYLAQLEDNRRISIARQDDERIELFTDEDWDEDLDYGESSLPEEVKEGIVKFLTSKTKAQLIELIMEYAQLHREVGADVIDRQQLVNGDTGSLINRVRREISEIAERLGWQNYWQDEGYTPDYSGIRRKMVTLLDADCADDVFVLGTELLAAGTRQVAESDDEGDTAMEIADCMPLIVKALDRSSLAPDEKLIWAVDVVLADEYDLCEPLAEYLARNHKKSDWHPVADTLLERLTASGSPSDGPSYSRDYARDQLSNWTIHALDHAGRNGEVIPLCESEAHKTGSYARLIELLIAEQRYEDAESWITDGIRAVRQQYPGTSKQLRNQLLQIRTSQQNWPVVAALQAEDFVRSPSGKVYLNCWNAATEAKSWSTMREHLLTYLEKGKLPWRQKDWPFPGTGLQKPEPSSHDQFPLIETLIDIAIYEKEPDTILRWYDRRPRQSFARSGSNDDHIATAVQDHAPDRAIGIWQSMAQESIARVKPSAYVEAVKHLKKARKIMLAQHGQKEWDGYLQDLRVEHARKKRLMEMLDGLDGNPILKKQ